jgi:hypothetical protein
MGVAVSNRLTYKQMHHPLEAVTTTGRGGVAGVVSVSTGRHGGLRGRSDGQREKIASLRAARTHGDSEGSDLSSGDGSEGEHYGSRWTFVLRYVSSELDR